MPQPPQIPSKSHQKHTVRHIGAQRMDAEDRLDKGRDEASENAKKGTGKA